METETNGILTYTKEVMAKEEKRLVDRMANCLSLLCDNYYSGDQREVVWLLPEARRLVHEYLQSKSGLLDN